MRALLAVSLLIPTPCVAQGLATSSGPDAVSVTVYRDPDRQPERRPNLGWLGGYAMISETRRVTIPAGEVTLRFEGVAAGMVPASAIVSGLPDGVLERNRDAWLLSPGGLIEASLGRRVSLRRTDPATGTVREVEAIVRSGADNALVLQTAEGVEALRCAGLPEALVFPEVPAGLSARPTFSVRTRAARPISAEVTLSYLAAGFDWTASYVATLSPAGDRIDLFAWATLANGDETSFRDAATQTVAGQPNRRDELRSPVSAAPVRLRCWSGGRTTDLAELARRDEGEEIVVTGSRMMSGAIVAPPPPPVVEPAMMAEREELGDLKFYRIPEPVTVAAKSQKQVAMLRQRGVRVSQIYRSRIASLGEMPIPVTRVLRTRNSAADGLGLPLPAGRLALMTNRGDRTVLLGQGSVRDHAIGEDVDIEAGVVTGIAARLSPSASSGVFTLLVTNDHARPAIFEAEFAFRIADPGAILATRRGRQVWRVSVPANGTATLAVRQDAP